MGRGGGGVSWTLLNGDAIDMLKTLPSESLRDQCQQADVPFFFKSWGEYEYLRRGASDGDGKYFYNHVGKKNSGRVLDGEEWNEYPKEGK